MSFDYHINEISGNLHVKPFRALKTRIPLVLIKALKGYICLILGYTTSIYSPQKKILIRALEKFNDFTREIMFESADLIIAEYQIAVQKQIFGATHFRPQEKT